MKNPRFRLHIRNDHGNFLKIITIAKRLSFNGFSQNTFRSKSTVLYVPTLAGQDVQSYFSEIVANT